MDGLRAGAMSLGTVIHALVPYWAVGADIAHSPRMRWLADSSYWIYIMHMPVVALLTFYLVSYDASTRT